MHVEVGQDVLAGQLLFEDRNTPGVRHTAPGAGRVVEVNRGPRRVLQSVVIELGPDQTSASFESRPGSESEPSSESIRALLVESGLWTGLRCRPFGKVPDPVTTPAAIFVTAIDTNPLAPDPAVVLEPSSDAFQAGLRLVARLTEGQTYLCVARKSSIGSRVDAPVSVEEFSGPHPAGTPGVHIHSIAPVSRRRTVWHIGYQDVVAIGELFRDGEFPTDRVLALGGPPLANPRLIRTRLGAAVADILATDDLPSDCRIISGSPLSGKTARDAFAYVGRYDNQVSVLAEDRERKFLGWIAPGLKNYSVFPVFLSSLLPQRPLQMTTSTNGSARVIIPNGQFERDMPMDLVPSYLLRALAVGDIERAEELGCLELIEEDLALCSFVDPGKSDFGPMLRKNLDMIERDG
jgi:Na+-transporting NADH:ubiquinone oxidoreductase subunit A